MAIVPLLSSPQIAAGSTSAATPDFPCDSTTSRGLPRSMIAPLKSMPHTNGSVAPSFHHACMNSTPAPAHRHAIWLTRWSFAPNAAEPALVFSGTAPAADPDHATGQRSCAPRGWQREGKEAIVGHGGRGAFVARGEGLSANEFLPDNNRLRHARHPEIRPAATRPGEKRRPAVRNDAPNNGRDHHVADRS